MKTELLIIDPQYDFCNPKGSLFVPGSEGDMSRLASFVHKNNQLIDHISVTLDSHSVFDIAHPLFWKNVENKHPDPFTVISHNDILDGKWMPSRYDLYNAVSYYTSSLEAEGKYPLCIWPPHCLVGSIGHSVVEELFKSLVEWENINNMSINYILKGTDPLTEHYSAIRPEVTYDQVDQADYTFLHKLALSDKVLIAGEAGSHCVASTVRDIVEIMPGISKKTVLLVDAMSPVPGYEKQQELFIEDMIRLGVNVSKTTEVLG